MQTKKYRYKAASLLLIFSLFISSCDWLVEVDPPTDNLSSGNVFTSDDTAIAAVSGIYAKMSSGGGVMYMALGNMSGPVSALPAFLALAADEITLNMLSNANLVAYYRNDFDYLVTASGSFWRQFYPDLFAVNMAIENLRDNTSLTHAIQSHLLGESLFFRALNYFYLVNLFGDVALALTSDYSENIKLARSPQTEVWSQIIDDLKEAKSLLSPDYLNGTLLGTSSDRVRVNKAVAAALLARVYLYTEQWAEAEQEASEVLSNTTLFSLSDLDRVFLMSSSGNKEAIWQSPPADVAYMNCGDGNYYILPATGPMSILNPSYLSNMMLDSFEEGDLRKTHWVNYVTTAAGITYHYPFKYKVGAIGAAMAEHRMVMRLGEQYLIRAEARAQQNKLSQAAADLNVIRSRAGLGAYTASDQGQILNAIAHERRVELFTEGGHRWFDLKRTGRLNEVMGVVTPQKGGSWRSDFTFFPLPIVELEKGVNLNQTPGY